MLYPLLFEGFLSLRAEARRTSFRQCLGYHIQPTPEFNLGLSELAVGSSLLVNDSLDRLAEIRVNGWGGLLLLHCSCGRSRQLASFEGSGSSSLIALVAGGPDQLIVILLVTVVQSSQLILLLLG